MSPKKSLDANSARACLDAAAKSGLTPTQWARVHRVDPRALDAWHHRLQPGGDAATDARMVELVLAPAPIPVPAPTAAPEPESARYVVRCGRMAVEVDDRFDDRVLRRLLAVVASC